MVAKTIYSSRLVMSAEDGVREVSFVRLMNLAALELACRVPGHAGMRPHHRQGIHRVPTLLQACIEGTKPPWALGDSRSLIVLAIDGIGFEVAAACWSPAVLVPLTSTFPSTSVCALLSAATGLTVEQHGVPGVLYRLDGEDALFDCLRDRPLPLREEWRTCADDALTRVMSDVGPWPTLFEAMSDRGIECVAATGDLANWPSRWADALVRGARVIRADRVPGDLDPGEAVRAAVREVERVLVSRDVARTLCAWTFINLDDYVHQRGYDDHLRRSLASLEIAVRRWNRNGHTVTAYSDHGMVPNAAPEALRHGWDCINGPQLCRLPAGGAGRVRWSYPRPRAERYVLGALADLLGENGLVVPRDELTSLGLLDMTDRLRRRIGEIVSIARGPAFPAPGREPFEHGSFTAQEMLALFSLWPSRS